MSWTQRRLQSKMVRRVYIRYETLMGRNLKEGTYQLSTSWADGLSRTSLSQTEMATGRLMRCRAETNCLMPAWAGSDGRNPSKKTFSKVGSTSVVLPPVSSCRAGARRGVNSLD